MDELKMNEMELDARLESPAQSQMKNLVQSMSDESVSLAWRSQLNERIQSTIESRRKKKIFAWTLSPALGLGLAGALAMVMMVKTPEAPKFEAKSTPPIEANLVASFENRMSYSDVTGVGLNPDEVVNGKSAPDLESIPEVDLGSL